MIPDNAPQWLKDAKTDNADVTINEDGCVEWCGGTWRGGTWHSGTWLTGVWCGGTWCGGTWCGGYICSTKHP